MCTKIVRAFAAIAAMLLAASAAHAADCNRKCLENWVDVYLQAVIKHDPSAAKLASNVRYTANGQLLKVGDGLWRTMQGIGKFRLVVADVPAQQVGVMTTFIEQGPTPKGVGGAIAIRLKIKNGQIAEIEQKELRDADAFVRLEASKLRPAFLQSVPKSKRMSRADLIKTANMYFSAVQQNDGKGVYPFANDCDRITNGEHGTNAPTPPGQTKPDPKTASGPSDQWTCLEQFRSGWLHFVSRIRDRRIIAVDQERGLVFAYAYFDHFAGDTRHFSLPDGRKVTAGPTEPWTWSIAEVFKIDGGLIHEIQAMELKRPYGMESGWSSWADGMSDKLQDATGVPAQ